MHLRDSGHERKSESFVSGRCSGDGSKVEITTLPGYLPTLAEQALPELKRAAELAATEGTLVREAAGTFRRFLQM